MLAGVAIRAVAAAAAAALAALAVASCFWMSYRISLASCQKRKQATSTVSGAQHMTAEAKHKDATSSTSHIPNSSCPVRR